MAGIDDKRWSEWLEWLSSHSGPMPSLSGIDLREKDLSEADLRQADLRGANLCRADLHMANLGGADLRGANLRGTDLRGADLRGAQLRGTDLRDANLDFAAWPLCCGSGGAIVNRWMVAQLAARICALQVEDSEWQGLREKLLPFARTSHRADELGLLDDPTGDSGEGGINGRN